MEIRKNMTMGKAAKIIAFYLPQFHPTPENDEWWGKGFTEWTNVARAKPLFPGHYQPRIPADLGFYDLRLPETRIAQAELAKKYGIEGFCYYHYWFGGRRILERPFNEILESGEPSLPFCLCWANHSWNSIWQGCPEKTLIEQTYPGINDHETHFYYLLRAFTDSRYMTVDGKQIFLVYKPMQLPEAVRVTDYWREMALKAGLKGLYLIGVSNRKKWNPTEYGFDASITQRLPSVKKRRPGTRRVLPFYQLFRSNALPAIYYYEDLKDFFILNKHNVHKDYPCLLPNWDNTPRSGLNGLVLHDSSPELFRLQVIRALRTIENNADEYKIIFLKAWNEWAEGNYVEPDMKYGRGYLNVIKEELLKKDIS
jgi:lipopolysaccharide biosynthesis protein